MNTTTSYPVAGMTCQHCASAVRDEMSSLPGVAEVAVNLDACGVSYLHITSDGPFSQEQVAQALDRAGDYHLVYPRPALNE